MFKTLLAPVIDSHWSSALDSGMVPVSLARCDGHLVAVEAVLEEVEDGKLVA